MNVNDYTTSRLCIFLKGCRHLNLKEVYREVITDNPITPPRKLEKPKGPNNHIYVDRTQILMLLEVYREFTL